MRIYNTMIRAKEEFVPREPYKVAMYVCGPTVYNHIHVGNARTFLSFDVIRRYLEHAGFEVTFVQNITDVDDKIINRAAEEGVAPSEIAAKYTAAFLDAMRDLGVKRPTVQPKATETIPEMIDLVERLIEGGHAYEVDGDVYFAVRSFPGYGELSGRDIDDLEAGARVEVDERKADPLDFALWKSAKPGEPSWPSPWGEGRPGWHLECSAMSERELGLPFDIHGGATDLVFPHHENERAQSEAATGRTFVRYWVHGGLLQVNSEKMSKSVGNFMLLKDVLALYDARVIRLLMLQTHYRSPLDYSTDRLDDAQATFDRIVNSLRDLRWLRGVRPAAGGADAVERAALHTAIDATLAKFTAEMDDDFNTAGALGAVFELMREANSFASRNRDRLGEEDLAAVLRAQQTIEDLLGVLGIKVEAERAQGLPEDVLELARTLAGYEGRDLQAAVDALLAARDAARTDRNWAAADMVRDGMASIGLIVEDTPGGQRVTYRPEPVR